MCHNYNAALEIFENMPVISHEIGQDQTIPVFDDEIPKFENSVFDPRNLKLYRNIMEFRSLLQMNRLFSRASAKVAAIN